MRFTCRCGLPAQSSLPITSAAPTNIQPVALTWVVQNKLPVPPHTCLSAVTDAAPEEKIVLSKHDLNYFLPVTVQQKKSQTKNWTWQSSAFVLFFALCLTSLIQNMRRALLSRLPRAAIWPAAPEAAGYRAQSNGGETLHCCEPSNGNLRAPEAAWEQTVRHIRFASVTEHQRLSLTARH